MIELIKTICNLIICVIIGGLIALAIICTHNLIAQKQCQAKCYMSDYVCHYGLFTGCMVNNGGRWVEYQLQQKMGDIK